MKWWLNRSQPPSSGKKVGRDLGEFQNGECRPTIRHAMKIRPGPGQRLVIFHLGLSENGVYPLNDDFIGDYDYLIVIHWNCGPLFSDKPLFPCSNDPLQYNPILGVKCGWVKITPTMEALVACRGLCDEGRRQFRLLRRNTEPNLARFRLQSYCFECKN